MKKTAQIVFRCTTQERAVFESLAVAEERTLSDALRLILRHEARRRGLFIPPKSVETPVWAQAAKGFEDEN